MGYILPINHDQYNQIVHRTTTYKTNQIRFHQVNPISLYLNQRSTDFHEVERKAMTKKHGQYIEKIRAEYTGQGLLYNESI